MRTADVIEHFGSKAKTARALGVGRAAVTKWGDQVPPLRAAQIQRLTRGKLKFDPDSYLHVHSGVRAHA